MINLKLSAKEKEGLNEDEIEIAMARKLEILMLPHIRRKLQFFYADWNLLGKKEAYNTPVSKEKVEEKIGKSEKTSIAAVCKPLCVMAAEILNENGIKAETVSCDTDIFGHTDVLITTKSHKKYIINYLEDIESIQSRMSTPNFASKEYYERYKKFEAKDWKSTDGKDLKGIAFLTPEKLDKIDKNLGYKQYDMYMDTVIDQIAKEFLNFKEIMAENEWLTKQKELEQKNASKEEMDNAKKEIYSKYQNMTKEGEVQAKLDWIFEFFNERGDITGHTDFVMYYSRLLLQGVLTPEEYALITRYDGFIDRNKIKENAKINEALDFENEENNKKLRFALVKVGDKSYAFSTKPGAYVTLSEEEVNELSKYAILPTSTKFSDLLKKLCDNGRGTPVLYHPLGKQIINERADMIDKNLSKDEREAIVADLVEKIVAKDDPMPSVKIPYPNGEEKTIYIDDNYEIILEEKDKKTIYHFNPETEEVEEEVIPTGTNEEKEI